jgi:hypothetical protein
MAAAAPRHRKPPRRRAGRSMAGPITLAAGFVLLAGGFVTYILWPRWPEAAADAPALPITVAGTPFNVPPNAIRVAVQRRPGAQARIDLAFVWPTLQPPDPARRADTTGAVPSMADRIFVTIASGDTAMAPEERLRNIYPRYFDSTPTAGENGLLVLPFRAGTPYQGEDLVYDDPRSAHFIARCTRDAGLLPGECLNERRIGAADVTVRFPREWLGEWQTVAERIERLLTSLRPAA